MEYKLGDEVMIVERNNFMQNIKSGNVKTGNLVLIRLMDDGKIVDTSYADAKTVANSKVIIGAKDKDGNRYHYEPRNKENSEYRIIPLMSKEKK